MAAPPIIPTSFVPHPSAGTGNSRATSSFGFGTILVVLAYFLFLVALVSSAGVFVYNRILLSEQTTKDGQLATAVASLNQSTIDQFLRLSNRFTSAKTLLDGHVALSGLLDLLGTVTPDNVSFTSLSVTLDDSGQATLQAAGVAKSFNTLAIASNDFGTNAELKNVIFSNLAIAQSGAVSFVLSAVLNPSLIAYTAPTGTPAPAVTTASTTAPLTVPVATSTATTTP